LDETLITAWATYPLRMSVNLKLTVDGKYNSGKRTVSSHRVFWELNAQKTFLPMINASLVAKAGDLLKIKR
jgi:hypothetical protein